MTALRILQVQGVPGAESAQVSANSMHEPGSEDRVKVVCTSRLGLNTVQSLLFQIVGVQGNVG